MMGWIGAILLAGCSLPLAYKSVKDGHSKGISGAFLIMWLLGEVFTLYYILNDLFSWQMILNYGINIIGLTIVIRYKIWQRN